MTGKKDDDRLCIECKKREIDMIVYCNKCIKKFIKNGTKLEELDLIAIEQHDTPLYREIADTLLTNMLQAPEPAYESDYDVLLNDLCYLLEVYSYANLLNRNREIIKMFKPIRKYNKLREKKTFQVLYNMIYYKIQNDEKNLFKTYEILQDDYHKYMKSVKKHPREQSIYFVGLMFFATALTKTDKQKDVMLKFTSNWLSCTAPIILYNAINVYIMCYQNKQLKF